MLFEPSTHEPLLDAAWDPARVEASIRSIAREADDALLGGQWWPLHPLDDDGHTPPLLHGVYFGAAGVLWALQRLADAGLHEPGHDYGALAQDVLASYRSSPELGGPSPSLWIGEGGIALVAWLLRPSGEVADRLAELVAAPPEGDTLELMWGSPGLLLIADAMLSRTGEERWRSAWSGLADHLVAEWGADGFWTQELYGQSRQLLGPAHGLAGVVAALARRPELLPHDRLAPKVTAALAQTAVRESDQANWPAARGGDLADGPNPIRTQWCHGAPGIVASVAGLPREAELDSLLLAGGELTWAAGPLRKGASLCHGTAGNGFALLKLFARTGDELWLERARRFAVHAAAQVAAASERYGRGRFSLWTGDVGTALYLRSCLEGSSEVPTIDGWSGS
jgi:hypothetical protein